VDRRSFLLQLAALASAYPARQVQAAVDARDTTGVDIRRLVRERARELSEAAYAPPDTSVPERLAGIGYDEYNEISFRSERGIWRDEPSDFEVQLFHRGFIFPHRMDVFVVEDGVRRRVAYEPALFDFGALGDIGQAGFGDMGFAGARVLYPINDPAVPEEFLVFLGASYFRAVGRNMIYGLSARGLALRTADPRGEEFPYFVEIYIERPQPGARSIDVHAVMDSPSVSGAYSFSVNPGEATRMNVRATLYPRVDLDWVGLAPLTSMYWFGPLERPEVDDFRPRVHDSDGLMIRTESEEWLWRPLANPSRLRVSSFPVGKVLGFGLAQRAQDTRDFQDLQAKYHQRPSLWIERHGRWPDGTVDLVEIPTESEFNDNIVAYWRPKAPLPAHKRFDYAYGMAWGKILPRGFGLLYVQGARSGAYADTWRQFVIDFASQEPGVVFDPAEFSALVSSSSGKVQGISIAPNPDIGGLRLTFLFVPDGPASDLRAVMRQGTRPVSEVWVYQWSAR
jgi:glucans biosynthesis protein